MKQFNVGILGFGLSGRSFFSPFIDAHPGFQLKTIVSSRSKEIRAEYPDVLVASPDELFGNSSIDLVVVASPNHTHYEYARLALLSGKHVIVEKPFTRTSEEARSLIHLAAQTGKQVIPFQNRRWDGDFLTVQKIISDGLLGQIVDYESHFDRFRPVSERVAWKNTPGLGTGTLYDLGPHLIDQALVLFGDPEYIYADIRTLRTEVPIDDTFEIQMHYPGLKVILKAGVIVREAGPRFAVHGRLGSFIKQGLDPQEKNLVAGIKPGAPGLGKDAPDNWGLLHTEKNGSLIRERIETSDGRYMDYFDNVYRALCGEAELTVKPADALRIIRTIEMAYESNREKRCIPFSVG
ncbi:MAG TPA: Gfo/Idh/MocA family oxidoreductase [Prolixibacteraceae bacterium]|nr:Gfo/Idh/MocA family oxidoreductase [Prolixibacteraceae bacterium]